MNYKNPKHITVALVFILALIGYYKYILEGEVVGMEQGVIIIGQRGGIKNASFAYVQLRSGEQVRADCPRKQVGSTVSMKVHAKRILNGKHYICESATY